MYEISFQKPQPIKATFTLSMQPTKLSQLQNDIGALTLEDLIEKGYVTRSDIDELGYVTEDYLAEQGYVTKTQLEEEE